MKTFNPIYTVSQVYEKGFCLFSIFVKVFLICGDLLTRRLSEGWTLSAGAFLPERSHVGTFSLLQKECRRAHGPAVAGRLDIGSEKLWMAPSSTQVHVCVEMQEFDFLLSTIR